jgi:hypothetical protein
VTLSLIIVGTQVSPAKDTMIFVIFLVEVIPNVPLLNCQPTLLEDILAPLTFLALLFTSQDLKLPMLNMLGEIHGTLPMVLLLPHTAGLLGRRLGRRRGGVEVVFPHADPSTVDQVIGRGHSFFGLQKLTLVVQEDRSCIYLLVE